MRQPRSLGPTRRSALKERSSNHGIPILVPRTLARVGAPPGPAGRRKPYASRATRLRTRGTGRARSPRRTQRRDVPRPVLDHLAPQPSNPRLERHDPGTAWLRRRRSYFARRIVGARVCPVFMSGSTVNCRRQRSTITERSAIATRNRFSV